MATIYKTFLAKGYLAKELPPAFSSELFAAYATTARGRKALATYKPSDNFTRCVSYQLALPGHLRRPLELPHPASYSKLAALTAKSFRRLLRKVARSPFSRSRPVYEADHSRALRSLVHHPNLARERAAIRAAASYLLQVDVSQFYPSLYTHAVGWGIDPKLRQRKHWNNGALLGKKVDQALMDLQGKLSQGIPIGPDISFLLAETVLAQVDLSLRLDRSQAYRWFDDYEIACNSREQAEQILGRLIKALDSYNLHPNPAKTRIVRLPLRTEAAWRTELVRRSKASALTSANSMVEFFDAAFSARERAPSESVLLYALGLLFKLECPSPAASAVAVSGITQSILAEPGSAQKGFALLTFWSLNGFSLDHNIIARTVDQVVLNHESSGLTSDISWALAFCLQNRLALSARSGRILSAFDNDCVTLQALDMHAEGLLPKGFSTKRISAALRRADLDDEHWLIAYEAHRHGFLSDSAPQISANPLFSDFLTKRVTFYRRAVPAYAMVIHPGGAPAWVVRNWIAKALQGAPVGELPDVARAIAADLEGLAEKPENPDEAILRLLRAGQADEFAAVEAGEDRYSV